MGGATLGRIAEAAGVDKRNITYYYGSREALLVRVVKAVGERIAQGIETAINTDQQTRERTTAEIMWAGITSEPELARAYITLLGGSAETPEIDHALQELKQTYLQMIARQLAHTTTNGQPADDPEHVAILILALLRGLLLEWAETGNSPALKNGLERVNTLLVREPTNG